MIEAILQRGQENKLQFILPYFQDPDTARIVELLCARFEASPPRLLSLVVDVGCLLRDKDLLCYLISVILAYSHLLYLSYLEYPVGPDSLSPFPGPLLSNLARALLALDDGTQELIRQIPCDLIR